MQFAVAFPCKMQNVNCPFKALTFYSRATFLTARVSKLYTIQMSATSILWHLFWCWILTESSKTHFFLNIPKISASTASPCRWNHQTLNPLNFIPFLCAWHYGAQLILFIIMLIKHNDAITIKGIVSSSVGILNQLKSLNHTRHLTCSFVRHHKGAGWILIG